jgi:hypothetical protein
MASAGPSTAEGTGSAIPGSAGSETPKSGPNPTPSPASKKGKRGKATPTDVPATPKKSKKAGGPRDPCDTSGNPSNVPACFWWDCCPHIGYEPEDKAAALEAKSIWVTELLDKGPFGVRCLVPNKELKQRLRAITGYLNIINPGVFYNIVIADFKRKGTILAALEAFRNAFDIEAGKYTTAAASQNRAREFQRYVFPRNRIGPDGNPGNSVIEVTEDQVKAGLPLQVPEGDKTVAKNYHYRSMVVAIGKVLLDYPSFRGSGPEPDPKLDEWYSQPCLLGFSLEEWNRGFFAVHHLLGVRAEAAKNSRRRAVDELVLGTEEEMANLLVFLQAKKNTQGFPIVTPYLTAADKDIKLAGGAKAAGKKKSVKLSETGFDPVWVGVDSSDDEGDPDFVDDDEIEDSDEDWLPTYDRKKARKVERKLDPKKGKKTELDPAEVIDTITQGFVDFQKKPGTHHRHRGRDVSLLPPDPAKPLSPSDPAGSPPTAGRPDPAGS